MTICDPAPNRATPAKMSGTLPGRKAIRANATRVLPAAITVRRPSRSEIALAGKDTTTPASCAVATNQPIVGRSIPIDSRYRLKSTQYRPIAAP